MIGYDAWTQGVIGDITINNVDNLDKIPKDPLTYKEYSYSLTSNKQEYQIAGILESDGYSLNNNILNGVNAEGTIESKAFVIGNYNGKILQVKGGFTIYILAMPSIVVSDLSDTNLVNIINADKLIFNHYKNLPSNYVGSKYIVDGEINLNLVNGLNMEVFSGSLSDLNDENRQIALIEGLQKAYSGTEIDTDYVIKEILSYNTEANPEGTKFLSQTIINNNISKSVLIKADNVIYNYDCEGLIGPNGSYPDFNLCDNIKINSISNIPTSTNLTNHSGNRDVYLIELEGGQKYIFETLGDDYDSDTDMSLYDNKGNLLVQNGDISGDIRRSKFIYTTTYTGYYYVGIMGRQDGGTYSDYTLSITKNISCAENPGYNNAEYIEGSNIIDGKAWQNINSMEGCYYQCINGYTGNDCSEESTCLSALTEVDKDNLNTFFNGYGYNGDIPYWCGLVKIDVWNTNIGGVIPNELGKLINLKELWLGENPNLGGTIPLELGNLINLKKLYLGDNTSMSGTIPSELGNLINLEELYLRNLGLTGTIPDRLFDLITLKKLWLNSNNFNTSISPLFGNFVNLGTIRISDSNFIGSIPPELGLMTNLYLLGLKGNNLSGDIPIELGQLTNLYEMYIQDNNLTGVIPGELGSLNKLDHLYLYNNNLTGAEQGFCDLIKDGTRNRNSPDSSTTNDTYGEYRDNPQDSDSDGNYDNTVNLCP